jgi:CheY-like chemotaxis protein
VVEFRFAFPFGLKKPCYSLDFTFFSAFASPNQRIAMSNQSNTEQEESPSVEKNQHILIIDDDVEVTESIRQALLAVGYSVSVALDGNQGLAYTEAKSPDLMILDIMMPRRSGFLVLERLRQNDSKPIPVIMITGNEGARHREYAEMLGVNDYINKPFTMDRLLASVSDLLE